MARKLGLSYFRKLGGKTYSHISTHKRKAKARKMADTHRLYGKSVRIVRTKTGYYGVFGRQGGRWGSKK